MSASNFYLKPIVHRASDNYFWIVTDPEDHAGRVRPDSQEDQEQGESKKPCDPEDQEQDKSKKPCMQ